MSKRNMLWLVAVIVVGLVGWLAVSWLVGIIGAVVTLAISEFVERRARRRRRAARDLA
jgi:uncharacterized BrkB/YihY/UPF0761 family membrane protein